MGVDVLDGLEPLEVLVQRAGHVNRVRREIGALEALRESVASGGPVVVISFPGSSKTMSGLAALFPTFDACEGTRAASAAAARQQGPHGQLGDPHRGALVVVNTPTLASFVAASLPHRDPGTLAEAIPPYRPACQWLRLAGVSLPGLPPSWEQPERAVGMAAWSQADGVWSRPMAQVKSPSRTRLRSPHRGPRRKVNSSVNRPGWGTPIR